MQKLPGFLCSFVPLVSCCRDLEGQCVPLQDLWDAFITHPGTARPCKGFSLCVRCSMHPSARISFLSWIVYHLIRKEKKTPRGWDPNHQGNKWFAQGYLWILGVSELCIHPKSALLGVLITTLASPPVSSGGECQSAAECVLQTLFLMHRANSCSPWRV